MVGKRARLGAGEVGGGHEEACGKRGDAGSEWEGKGHVGSMRESEEPHKGKPGLGLKNSKEKPAQAVRAIEGSESQELAAEFEAEEEVEEVVDGDAAVADAGAAAIVNIGIEVSGFKIEEVEEEVVDGDAVVVGIVGDE